MKKAADKNGGFEMERFITVWQKARTMQEVVRAFPGYTAARLAGKAVYLRKKQVPMRKFRAVGHSRYDFAALAALAKKLEPK